MESRKASVRAKVEHPFLFVKRDFGFTKTWQDPVDRSKCCESRSVDTDRSVGGRGEVAQR